MRRRRGSSADTVPDWTRQKMLALLIATSAAALAVLLGIGLAIYYAVTPAASQRTTSDGAGRISLATTPSMHIEQTPSDARNELAARPMPHVDEEASHPDAVSTRSPGAAMAVPPATTTGPAAVPTGFPHTPVGALAQLTAIDQVAIQSASLTTARDVVAHWSQPGGPTVTSWSTIDGLATLLTQSQTAGSSQLALVLTPLMGLIKGTVGPDFVVPCVDFELDITLQQTARGAVADCQRMTWQTDRSAEPAGGRWVIAPGTEPATPPSVWPDTELAIAVGYHDLREEG